MASSYDVATAAAAGPTHCLLATRLDVYAIGSNRQGQLGVGDTNDRHEFSRVPLREAALSLAAGAQHSLVATVEGRVYVFGSNEYGQLGLDSEEEGTAQRTIHSAPRQIVTLRDHFIVDVAAGSHHSIALSARGEVYVWGLNNAGQLGLGHRWERPSPVVGMAVADVISITCGASHTVLALSNGSVWTSGSNDGGQLGLGDRDERDRFTEITFQPVSACDSLDPANLSASFIAYVCAGGPDRPMGSSIVRVASGDFHTLAIASDGHVWAWGLNDHGQLGIGNLADGRIYETVPTPLTALFGSNATSAAGGSSHSLIRTDFHDAIIHEVLPRMGPAAASAATHVWFLGLGLNSLRQHRLECVFEGAAAQFRTTAHVFSNFRAVCPSPAAAALPDYMGPYKNSSSSGRTNPLHRISLYSFGAPATDDTSSQPRQPVSEMTGRTVPSRGNFSFYLLQECNSSSRSECAAECSQGSPWCFAGIVSSDPRSGPREGGTNVTVIGYGFYEELASDVRCRFGDHLLGTEVWSRGLVLNQTHLVCQSTNIGQMPGLSDGGDRIVQLRVSLNGQDYSVSWPFFYYRQPRVSHTSAPSYLAAHERWLHRPEFPYGGPNTGGSLVEVHSPDSLQAAALGEARCSFGSLRVDATFVTPSRVRCFAPPLHSESSAYTVAVSVLLDGRTQVPAGDSYHAPYVAYYTPQVDRIVPGAAPTRVPIVLRVIGANLNAFSWFPRWLYHIPPGINSALISCHLCLNA